MLGIDMQTVFGMPPVDYVRLAAELGCSHISAALEPMPWNPCNFPAWSLRDDANMLRELKTVMRDTGVSIFLAEGFTIRPTTHAVDRSKDLDLLAELGAKRINTVCMEPDLARGYDELSKLSEMSMARGLALTLEFAPPHPINNLQAALAAIKYVGSSRVQLTLDTMHFFRSGGTIDALKALDSNQIGYAQLCDAPFVPLHSNYMQEACFERLPPGDGELPLREFVAALPKDIRIGIEIPMVSAVNNGAFKNEIARAVVAAHKLLG